MGVPKSTEMTIRNFLLKELEKRGVKVNTEILYTTPIGRLMPDIHASDMPTPLKKRLRPLFRVLPRIISISESQTKLKGFIPKDTVDSVTDLMGYL